MEAIIKCCGCQKIAPLGGYREQEVYGRQLRREYCSSCADRLGLTAAEPEPTPEQLSLEKQDIECREKQQAQRLFDQGLSLHKIAIEMLTSWNRVQRLLSDYPPYLAYQRSGRQRQQRQQASVNVQLLLDLYQIGFSACQLESLLGASAGTLRSRLREAGVEIRSPNQRLTPNPIDLLRVLNKHQWEVPEPLKKLAKDWGLSPSEDSPVFAVQQRRAG